MGGVSGVVVAAVLSLKTFKSIVCLSVLLISFNYFVSTCKFIQFPPSRNLLGGTSVGGTSANSFKLIKKSEGELKQLVRSKFQEAVELSDVVTAER